MPARALDPLLERVRPAPTEGGLTVDLGDLDWVTPTTMVAVAAQAQRAAAAGQPFAVRAPRGTEPASYAARMRLGRVLTSLGAAHDLPAGRERDQRDNLVELTAITTESDAARLAALVFAKLDPHDPDLARALHRSIGEVGVNVPDHAGAIGFMAAQTMPRRRSLLVAVADAGIGLLATLAARGARDHEEAIEYATRPAVSQYDDPTRGGGLPTTLRLIGDVGGSVYIASGTASIRHHARTRRFLRADLAYPGTIVEARIPLAAHPSIR
jgi:hypothetical protein